MNPKEISRILDAVSADFIPADINLLSEIEAHFKSQALARPRRIQPAFAVVLILLALGLLTGVAYAVAQSLGFIPGAGLVDLEHGVRVLSKPVAGGRDKILVTVEQVIADSARTQVTYRVAGIPWVERGRPICLDAPLLQLPDGQKLESAGSSGGIGMKREPGNTTSFENTLNFPPVPSGTNKLYFLPPCGQPKLTLELVPAPVGFATPAVEIGAATDTFTPSVTMAASTPAHASANTVEAVTASALPRAAGTHTPTRAATTGVSDHSSLHLDKVIELANAYILIGNFTGKGDLPVTIISISDLDSQFQITDQHGKAVHFKPRPEVLTGEPKVGVVAWAYEIPKPVDGPVTIRLASIPIPDQETTHFQVDAQNGQKWEVNQNVQLGGYAFTIDSLEKTGQGYTLRFHSGPEVPDGLSFGLDITGSSSPSNAEVSANASTDTRKPERVDYSETLTYKDSPPEGKLSLAFTLYQTIQFPGPWTLTWSPPSSH